ncbi:MAG TPA: DUF1109 domain-containing protein [Rhizobium sp.]|nr:DUF1109 domain-containing protein [Rhizobium sp.]
MKTTELISLIAADAPSVRPLGPAVSSAVAVGICVSLLLMLSTIGLRDDIATAIETARVAFKIGMTLLLAALSTVLVFRVGRPGASLGAQLSALLLPLVLLAGAVGAELYVSPASTWGRKLVGENAAFCLFFIPVLSAAPLIALMTALRRGAPDNPTFAGAVAGLASGSIAAAIYAWHCPDDSPLFGATWYMLAIGMVILTGAFLGRRLLRW